MLACGGLGGALCRSAYATEWARMMVYLQAMRGMGKPGIGMWTTNQGAPFNGDFLFPGYAEGGYLRRWQQQRCSLPSDYPRAI